MVLQPLRNSSLPDRGNGKTGKDIQGERDSERERVRVRGRTRVIRNA